MPSPGLKQKDPIQEALRKHKRQWSATYKDVSQKLKALKNGLNGKGDVKFNLPPSDIKLPMPNEIGSFLEGVASEFQQLMSDAHSILQEQGQYSKTRRKKKPKPTAAPVINQPQPTTDVVDTLSRLGTFHNEMLEVYSSNKLTRLWQYMGSPFTRKQFNKQRLGLLSLTADLYYSLSNFENEILTFKGNNIPKTLATYQATRSIFDAINATIEKLSEQNISAPNPTIPPNTNTTDPIDTDVDKIYSNTMLVSNFGFGKSQLIKLINLIKSFKEEADPNTKSMLKDRIKEDYANLMQSIKNDVQKKFGPVNTAEDIINTLKNKINESKLGKQAHNRLTRFLKRQLIKSRPFDSTAAPRLEIVDNIVETRKILQKMMDSLESNLDIGSLQKFIGELTVNMTSINKTISVLITLYEKEFYQKERNKPIKHKNKKYNDFENEDRINSDQFTDYLMRRKLRKDISRGIV